MTTLFEGEGHVNPLMMAHYPIQSRELPPILCCITYYLCRLRFISGSISCYCTPLSPIYRKDIISFQTSLDPILSCVLSTLCKEVPPSKRIDIYLYSSLLRHGSLSCFLFYSLFMLFMGFCCITFGIRALSSALASTKRVTLEFLCNFSSTRIQISR